MRHGLLLVDKARGPTSHDVVDDVRHHLHERKIGHLGTLDPDASGLLVLAVGTKALKVVELFSGLTKEYIADVRLGATSSTYDADGVIEQAVLKPGVVEPDQVTIQNAIADRFVGKISQVPPAHSAVHVDGKRAYELARQGKEVTIAARQVDISECKILSYAYPDLRLRVGCSSGTYIRSLANDLGVLLHVGGYLSALRRTKVGEWKVEDAVLAGDASWTHVIPLKDVLRSYPAIDLSGDEMQHIQHGRPIGRRIDRQTFGWFEELPVAILVPSPQNPDLCCPRKVL